MEGAKTHIDKTTWALPNGRKMVSHTSSWCAPCQRIKPHLEFLQENKAIAKQDAESIHMNDRRPGMKIPTFDFFSMDDSVLVESIQTSDSVKFNEILHKYDH
jgi:thiol-disulfide isomerase/thioredoxin